MLFLGKGKPPLEAAEEKEFLKLLKKLPVRLLVRKMNGLGNRNYPDRMILGPNQFIMFVEMKRKKIGKLSPGQEAFFDELGELGHEVRVFDDGAEAAAAVKHALEDAGLL